MVIFHDYVSLAERKPPFSKLQAAKAKNWRHSGASKSQVADAHIALPTSSRPG